MDFSGIISAIDFDTVVTAIIAVGAVMILPNVARWGVRKLVTFFG